MIRKYVLSAIKYFGWIKFFLSLLFKSLAQDGLIFTIKKIITKLFNFKTFDIVEIDFQSSKQSIEYQNWISLHDKKFPNNSLKEKNLKNKPLISIVMPTYNSNIEWLKDAIQSVKNQIYINWELCIADDNSTNETLKKFIHDLSKSDKRIKVILRNKNGHISHASNSALSLANGEWVGLLDHDDKLSIDALYFVVEAINNNIEANLIFSDEDKIDEDNRRFSPYFKPGWNKDLFYSQNLISHFGVYRKKFIDKINGFRVGYEGSQDWDLALRFIEQIPNESIIHIPKILYHWRVHDQSVAKSSEAKPYAYDSAKKALDDHFRRTKQNAKSINIGYGFKTQFHLAKKYFISIIIPSKNNFKILKKCLDSIFRDTSYPSYEIIIVDNNSTDPKTLEFLNLYRNIVNIRVLYDKGDFNFSRLINLGVSASKGDHLLILNDDTEIISNGWLSIMVSHCQRKDIGVVGCKLIYPNNKIQHIGVQINEQFEPYHPYTGFLHRNSHGYFGRNDLNSNYIAITGACLMVQRKIFLQVNGFDENLKVAYNDIDFCLKVYFLSKRNIVVPEVVLMHYESYSRGNDLISSEKKQRLIRENKFLKDKWFKNGVLKSDPYVSPCLNYSQGKLKCKN